MNYHKGVWHHYLMPINDGMNKFMVIDRNGNDENCIETQITKEIIISLT